MNSASRPPFVLLVCLSLFIAGCGEEGLFATTATVSGEVVDSGDNGIFGVNVGVAYFVTVLSGAGGPADGVRPAGRLAAASSGLPYPNPVGGVLVSLRVQVTEPTDLSLEIWEELGGIPGLARSVFVGRVEADTTVDWDTRDDFDTLVPNGLYHVRVTAPLGVAEPTVSQTSLLVNRSDALMENLSAFNTASDPDGFYLLTDLAVGRTFTRTGTSGAVLGQGLVSTSINLVFRDQDFLPKNEPVVLGPRETVEIKTVLTPIFNRPRPEGGISHSIPR